MGQRPTLNVGSVFKPHLQSSVHALPSQPWQSLEHTPEEPAPIPAFPSHHRDTCTGACRQPETGKWHLSIPDGPAPLEPLRHLLRLRASLHASSSPQLTADLFGIWHPAARECQLCWTSAGLPSPGPSAADWKT